MIEQRVLEEVLQGAATGGQPDRRTAAAALARSVEGWVARAADAPLVVGADEPNEQRSDASVVTARWSAKALHGIARDAADRSSALSALLCMGDFEAVAMLGCRAPDRWDALRSDHAAAAFALRVTGQKKLALRAYTHGAESGVSTVRTSALLSGGVLARAAGAGSSAREFRRRWRHQAESKRRSTLQTYMQLLERRLDANYFVDELQLEATRDALQWFDS